MTSFVSLSLSQLKMYVRDRQSLFLAFIFPLLLMSAFGFVTGRGATETTIGVIPGADPAANAAYIEALDASSLISVRELDEESASTALEDDVVALVLYLPDVAPDAADPVHTTQLRTIVDASDAQGTGQAYALVEGALKQLEYKVRGLEPMFALEVADVKERTNLRYVDFLVPGLLAFMVMQLAVAGSGFNIVEYKRKGILKRLFVTPLSPFTFISSLIAMRLLTIIVQIGIILLLARFAFGFSAQGSLALMFAFVIGGAILFLSLGFVLGGIASTQNAIILLGNLFIFPQVFLAAVFFPASLLPDWMQGAASLLPLNFLSHALRSISNDGAGLVELWPDILGISAWIIIGILMATRLFRWGDTGNS
ncbi:ABC transporter permease [Cucumibacter marinus]|uniref:ABC transporter permease n=1 Tax=Cucumibacter marinus TaxID=1121252 RepID=UPI00040C7D82|nr:ABC transporter permease [Cucumibacter marinus]